MYVSVPQLEIGPTGIDAAPGDVQQSWFDDEGRLIASGGRTAGRWWMHWRGLATYWFGDSGDVVAEPVSTGLAQQVRDAFVRGVTPVVLLARGFEALHASAVLHPNGVIGFCGRSGTGKSTLALALAALGLPHFADDTIVFRPATFGRPLAFALPSRVRVDSLARRAANAPATTANRALRSSTAPVHRMYHLVRDDAVKPRSPEFSRIHPALRFERLLAHAHPFDMGSDDRRRAFFENLMAFARQVDVWECRFAPDLEALSSFAAEIRAHASVP